MRGKIAKRLRREAIDKKIRIRVLKKSDIMLRQSGEAYWRRHPEKRVDEDVYHAIHGQFSITMPKSVVRMHTGGQRYNRPSRRQRIMRPSWMDAANKAFVLGE